MTATDDDPRLLRLADDDNVAAVRATIDAGETISIAGTSVTVGTQIPTGHKIAVRPVAVMWKAF